MESIKNYQTVCAANVGEFDAAVNRRIALGWQPYGAPYVIEGTLCQAMVQIENNEDNDDTREYEHGRDRLNSLRNRFPHLGTTEIEITRR